MTHETALDIAAVFTLICLAFLAIHWLIQPPKYWKTEQSDLTL